MPQSSSTYSAPNALLLHGIMALHTVIVAICLTGGLIIAALAYRNDFGAFYWFLAIFPIVILIIRFLTGRICILQRWARLLRGTESGWARDIYFFNEKWAMRVVRIGTMTYIAGTVVALAIVTVRQAWI